MHHRFHLIVATNRPPEFLERSLRSYNGSSASVFVTVVAQRPAPEIPPLLATLIAEGSAEYIHQPGIRGVSHARNAGVARMRGDIVGFPDDDCWYPDGLLAAIDERFTRVDEEPRLAVLCMACRSPELSPTMLRWLSRSCRVRSRDVPRTVICSGMFFRRSLLEDIGGFDETLGTGVEPFGSAEENDLVIRAISAGARVDFDAGLMVHHPDFRSAGNTPVVLEKVRRYNRGFGRVLRKHGLWGQAAYWVLRSAAAVYLARRAGDPQAVRFQREQLVGRWQGWWGRDDQGARYPIAGTARRR